MARPTSTFLDETLSAARGFAALVVGNRQASSFYDFRQAGLVGSFIALLLGVALQAFAPQFLGHAAGAGAATGTLILSAMVLGMQLGVAYLVLRLLGRGDGFVPFVVVQNWVTFFQSILAVAIIAIFGQPIALAEDGQMIEFTSGSLPFLILGIMAMIVWVNIARLILTLRPAHVALFVFVQLGAAFLLQPVLGALV